MEANTIEALVALSEALKKIEKDQHTIIEHIAKVQIDLQDSGKPSLAEKIGQVFSNASKNTEHLHDMIEEIKMEINKIKAQG